MTDMSDMTIIYEIILENGRESTYRFLDMGIAHHYMMQLMKNSMGFSFGERDVKSGSTAYQSILSKQDLLHDIATGKLPFDTRVPITKVQKTKTRVNSKSKETKAEEAKLEEAKVEEAKVEETKVEETKVEKIKVEQAKVEQAKVEQAKAEEIKVKQAKVEKAKVEKAKVEKAKAEEIKVKQAKVEKAKELIDASHSEKETHQTTITIIESNAPTGCIYKMMRGERKGESCNKPCSKDSTFCKTHK
jgi:hypothetical protein